MRVLIMTLGTRGDVQPFVALAQALQSAGDSPVVCAPQRYQEFVTARGVSFVGVDDGPLRLLDSPAEAGRLIRGGLRTRLAQMRQMPGMFTQLLEDCWRVATTGAGAGADVVVHNGQILAGQHVAEALRVPAVLGLPIPLFVPTRAFSWPGQAVPNWWPTWWNRTTYAGMRMPAVMFGRVIDRWRRDTLGLRARPSRHDPTRQPDGTPATVLHAYSPSVLPRPTDWPTSSQVTGYWFLTPSDGLPEEVERFLSEGSPPVFAGFGSMTGLQPHESSEVVVQAAAATGLRLIMDCGWGGLDAAAATAAADRFGVELCLVHDLDYQLLFPQVAAVVHHGGAGTTGTAFAAGRPQVICPFVADQPFWARLAQARGVASEPLPQQGLTTIGLTERLRLALSWPTRQAATLLGARVAAEQGLTQAVHVIHQTIAERRSRPPGDPTSKSGA